MSAFELNFFFGSILMKSKLKLNSYHYFQQGINVKGNLHSSRFGLQVMEVASSGVFIFKVQQENC